MLVDPRSETSERDCSPRQDRHQPESVPGTRRPASIPVFLLAAVALGAGAYRVFVGPFGRPEPALVAVEKAQPLIRAGDRVTVPPGSPVRAKLAIQPVAEHDVQRSLILPAVVEADPAHLIKVSPPLAGRVLQLNVQLGERVEAGQPLVIIDSPDLAAAYADYDRAKVLLALALKSRDRQRGLAKIGGAAEKDLQLAETDYVTAEVELKRAAAHLKQIGVDAETTNKSRTVTVVAPMSGSVIDLAVAPGAFWNDATAAMMTVADLSTVWITASVPEKDTAFVAKGQAVDVVFPAYPGEVFKGHALFVSDVLDPDTRRTKVRIAFENPATRLKPNMFANVSVLTPVQKRAAVPTTALVMKNDGDRVFVEVEPWTFEARPVEVDFQEGDQTIVKSGLRAGERVVVKGGVLLND